MVRGGCPSIGNDNQRWHDASKPPYVGTGLADMRRTLPAIAGLSMPDPPWPEESYRTAVVWIDVGLGPDSTAATQENWGGLTSYMLFLFFWCFINHFCQQHILNGCSQRFSNSCSCVSACSVYTGPVFYLSTSASLSNVSFCSCRYMIKSALWSWSWYLPGPLSRIFLLCLAYGCASPCQT